ncbi:adenosine deaminase [Rhizobium leguminosarum]
MTSHLKKVELHCHLEGAAPPALTAAQAQKYGVDISAELRDGAYVWHDFASFLECYDKVSEVYRTEEDYALLTETYLDELAGIHTIYSELIVSPDHGKRIGLGADPYIAGICEGIRRAREKSGIEARLIVTGERHFGPESVIGAAEYAAKAGNPLITGFNLAGEERMGRVADYARAFDIARDAGLGLTIHAGEVCARLQRRRRARCGAPLAHRSWRARHRGSRLGEAACRSRNCARDLPGLQYRARGVSRFCFPSAAPAEGSRRGGDDQLGRSAFLPYIA